MAFNILLLLIILLSAGGIVFIISRKFFYLANINLEMMPEEKAAQTKKKLIEERIKRQTEEWQRKIKIKILDLESFFARELKGVKMANRFKIIIICLIKINLWSKPKIERHLIFFKNKVEFIKNKYRKKD
jgi:hypothetical protein